MTIYHVFVGACLSIATTSGTSLAVLPTRDGTEAGFWSSRALVLVEIVNRKEDDVEKGQLSARIVAVLATQKLLRTQLQLPFNNQGVPGLAYSGRFRLKVGEFYVMCLYSDEKGEWRIVPSILAFMPSSCGVEKVTGLDDPLLKQVADRVAAVMKQSWINAAKLLQEETSDAKKQ